MPLNLINEALALLNDVPAGSPADEVVLKLRHAKAKLLAAQAAPQASLNLEAPAVAPAALETAAVAPVAEPVAAPAQLAPEAAPVPLADLIRAKAATKKPGVKGRPRKVKD